MRYDMWASEEACVRIRTRKLLRDFGAAVSAPAEPVKACAPVGTDDLFRQ